MKRNNSPESVQLLKQSLIDEMNRRREKYPQYENYFTSEHKLAVLTDGVEFKGSNLRRGEIVLVRFGRDSLTFKPVLVVSHLVTALNEDTVYESQLSDFQDRLLLLED